MSHNYYVTKDVLEKLDLYDENYDLCEHNYTHCPNDPENFDDTELDEKRIIRLPELNKFVVRSRVANDDSIRLYQSENVYVILYTRIEWGFMLTVKRLQNNNPALIHYTAIAGIQNVNIHFNNYEPDLSDIPDFDLNSYNSILRKAKLGTSIVLRVTNQLIAYWGVKPNRVQRLVKGQYLHFAMDGIINDSYPTEEKSSFLATRNDDKCSVYHFLQILPSPLAVYHVHKLDYRNVRDELDNGHHEFDAENIKRVIDYKL